MVGLCGWELARSEGMSGEYPVRLLCQVVGLAPSSYYHESRLPDDTRLGDQIEQIAVLYPRYGYRRITVELSRRGIAANHNAVLRIMREQSLLVVVHRYVHTTWSGHDLRRFPNLLKGRVVEAPDEVWCADITYIRLRQGFVYLAVVLDIYTRLVRGWALGRGLDVSLTMRALEQALAQGRPQIHHSDQGVQYCAGEYVEAVLASGAAVSMAATGQPCSPHPTATAALPDAGSAASAKLSKPPLPACATASACACLKRTPFGGC